MFKKLVLPACLTMATLAVSTPAKALDVAFDPTGGGSTALRIDVLDPTVGNSIALGGGAFNTNGDQVTALFQANLGVTSLGGTVNFSNGDVVGGAARFFTIVAGFSETVVSNSGGSFPTVVDALNPSGPVNFFTVYAVSATASNLNGTGFTSLVPVLGGVFISTAQEPGISNFTVTGGGAGTPLDGFGANNYSGTSTLSGSGGFRVLAEITSKNAGYFPDLVLGTTLSLVTSQLTLNYGQVDPSTCFINTTGTTSCVTAGVSSVGAVNVLSGRNSMFQTDANSSFQAPVPVPEPATLTLLGLGLVGVATRGRKRNQKK